MKNTFSQGRRPDLGNIYFRSSWEANYARILNHQGIAWEYEPKTFYFEAIKTGTRSYKPDFFIKNLDEYHEVKGWMDPKSKTKLTRMAKYYPDVKIVLIDAKRMKELSSYASIIPKWEHNGEMHVPEDVNPYPKVQNPPKRQTLLNGKPISYEEGLHRVMKELRAFR